MGTETTALEAGETALAAGNRERALGKLLVARRAVRHPRIADVIDFVSSEITATQAPIAGKTAAARIAAWHAIERRREPASLGQLLATPWPGTWQRALPVLQPLLEWPDDPRMAMAFARIIDETRYATWTSDRFYAPLFGKLDKTKPYYSRRDMRPLEEAAAATFLDT